jgi:hypothetical protein
MANTLHVNLLDIFDLSSCLTLAVKFCSFESYIYCQFDDMEEITQSPEMKVHAMLVC